MGFLTCPTCNKKVSDQAKIDMCPICYHPYADEWRMDEEKKRQKQQELINRKKMERMGVCSKCGHKGYEKVDLDSALCPNCGHKYPRPVVLM
jgi:rubrerythrin